MAPGETDFSIEGSSSYDMSAEDSSRHNDELFDSSSISGVVSEPPSYGGSNPSH